MFVGMFGPINQTETNMKPCYLNLLSVLLLSLDCEKKSPNGTTEPSEYTAFANPQRVTIQGYNDHAMEPFITRDGRYLLFNNLNQPSVNTNLHYAERIDDVTFEYMGIRFILWIAVLARPAARKPRIW